MAVVIENGRDGGATPIPLGDKAGIAQAEEEASVTA